MSDNDFESFVFETIERIYNPTIHNGWCMFGSSAVVLAKADVVFIGMNPGGSLDYEEHADQKQLFMPEGHCPYTDEVWDGQSEKGAAKLQKQVVEVFKTLGLPSPIEGLCGNIVPFRTSNWKDLSDKENTLNACAQIWKRVYAMHPRKVTICMGYDTCDTLLRYVLGSTKHIKDVRLSWGSITASLWEYQGGVMIRLPHLSRYSVFGRPESKAALDEIFAPACAILQTLP